MVNEKINWFPGHMAKTRRMIQDNISLVDVVIVMMDSRVPLSGYNPLIDELVSNKPLLYIMAKSDLAEEKYTVKWIDHYNNLGRKAISCNFKASNGKQIKNQISNALRETAKPVLEKRKAKGIIDETIRVMVCGIPNVGKSTLINLFAGKNSCETGDRPGVTKNKKWLKLDFGIELLDMPGILWPKIDDPEAGRKLAVTGAIGNNAYDFSELGVWAISWLKNNRPGRLKGRFGIDESKELDDSLDNFMMGREVDDDEHRQWNQSIALLEEIGKKRGFLRKGGVVEVEKTAIMLLDEIRGGKLGAITWDEI